MPFCANAGSYTCLPGCFAGGRGRQQPPGHGSASSSPAGQGAGASPAGSAAKYQARATRPLSTTRARAGPSGALGTAGCWQWDVAGAHGALVLPECRSAEKPCSSSQPQEGSVSLNAGGKGRASCCQLGSELLGESRGSASHPPAAGRKQCN